MNKLLNITTIAKRLGLNKENLELCGNNKAKICNLNLNPKGKLILVTAINPTTSGEGKTTVSIGLADAFSLLHKKICLALREPSLGPVFGIKGGATGGGKARVEPSDDINLHFTGDFHAITSANNLLSAFIDNHIFQGNSLNIDPNKILFHRCMDMNDRALREITINEEPLKRNIKRQESFSITAASEIMAILCLAKDIDDLKERLGNILVGFSKNDNPIYAKDLHAQEAMTILLKEAIKPNLVQTLNQTPCIIHGGPFANIAHGCNSIIATKTAMTLADYCITEAGFGADLGGQKFLDMKMREANLNPNVVVIVATIKAIKLHSKDGESLKLGFENLEKHIENIRKVYNKKVIVALNKFAEDSPDDLQKLLNLCSEKNIECSLCSPFIEGGKGCIELAQKVLNICEEKNTPLTFSYNLKDSIENKIYNIATKIYGAKNVIYSEKALNKLEIYNKIAPNYHVIIAKTQYSLSDNPKLIGKPDDFSINVTDLEIKNGARFIVAIAGNISLMPGLPKVPNGEKMFIDHNGKIYNLK